MQSANQALIDLSNKPGDLQVANIQLSDPPNDERKELSLVDTLNEVTKVARKQNKKKINGMMRERRMKEGYGNDLGNSRLTAQ